MMNGRRDVLRAMGSATLATLLSSSVRPGVSGRPTLKPPRLKAGNTVGLVNPAGATFHASDILIVRESLAALGLQCAEAEHLLDRRGYFAGTDADRAADLNRMFADPGVHAVMAVRGGWGCNRILPLLDYDAVSRAPKIVIGYSDITSLLLALRARTGLVTFHGPVGTSTWNAFSVHHFRRVLWDAEPVTLRNPTGLGDTLTRTADRVEVITPGTATGTLVGGNLAVLTSMIGSEYLPTFDGAILFLEDDGEQVYRVDRMLTQLSLAGVLKRLAGVIFGKCTNCTPGEGYGSLTLEEVLADHIRPLGIPAWYGAMIGHIENKFTVPLGVDAEIDAGRGTIRLLESAVA